ncbi:MAG: hypothetical protein F6J87_14735 [Spirulina sp. SIO3F2]|nr:hypothetical protein [Spirulina sp. SIO3F2]
MSQLSDTKHRLETAIANLKDVIAHDLEQLELNNWQGISETKEVIGEYLASQAAYLSLCRHLSCSQSSTSSGHHQKLNQSTHAAQFNGCISPINTSLPYTSHDFKVDTELHHLITDPTRSPELVEWHRLRLAQTPYYQRQAPTELDAKKSLRNMAADRRRPGKSIETLKSLILQWRREKAHAESHGQPTTSYFADIDEMVRFQGELCQRLAQENPQGNARAMAAGYVKQLHSGQVRHADPIAYLKEFRERGALLLNAPVNLAFETMKHQAREALADS